MLVTTVLRSNMNPPDIPVVDVANVPLAFLPHGANNGDTFMVELVGRDGTDGIIRLAPTASGLPQGPVSPQAAQAMPLPQLQNYLAQQAGQRNLVNPPPPVNQ